MCSKTLEDPFYNYISTCEKNIIQWCLGNTVFDYEMDDEDLCDICSDCGIADLPSLNNIEGMILDAGKKVFIQKAFFILKKIKIGLVEFWRVGVGKEIDALWSLEAPTSTIV